MVSFECKGVLVDFPYEPYEVQKIYIEKVLECLQNVSTYIKLNFHIFNLFVRCTFRVVMAFWSLLLELGKLCP